jgi:predicted DNA binding CopG/RHH family protein
MTITRRPPRPAAPPAAKPARRRKTPETFIEEAHHPAVAVPIPEPQSDPEPAPEAAEAAKPAKKAQVKDKDKSKGKEKHKKRKDKEAVLIRFEDEQLTLMDERAAALGLSRAAWLRMLVSKALRGKKS